MMKKSLVEKMNSWKPFLDEINGSLKAKDFRKKTIIQALSTLDPTASLLSTPFFQHLLGILIGPGFFIGREALYGKIFDTFLTKNKPLFRRAPLIVIQTFNTFVKTLFEHPEKRILAESMARKNLTKEEKILKKAEISRKKFSAFVKRQAGKALPEIEEAIEEEPEEEILGLGFKKREELFSNRASIDEKTCQFFENLREAGEPIDTLCIAAIEEKTTAFSHFIHTFPSLLPSSSYGPFIDLKARAEALDHTLLFTEEELKTLLKISPEEREQILLHKIASAKEPYESIIKKAIELNKLIEKIKLEITSLKTMLDPFLKKLDTKARVEILLSELKLLEINKNILEKKTETLESELQERKEKIVKLKKAFETEFRDLLVYIRNLECQLDEARWSIVFSRFEIFSRKQPYPDLGDLVEDVRSNLTALLKKCGEDLIIGTKNIRDIIREMFDAAYAHNVKLARKEIIARSLRLKDIREEVGKELHKLNCSFCLMKQEDIREDLLTKRIWLFHFFTKLTDPFSLFKDTFDPASINTLFRYFWIDLDRWRKSQVHIIQEKGDFSSLLDHMKKLFLSTEDFSEKKGPLFCLLTQIAKLPYGEREQKLKDLKALEEKKKDIINSARAIQTVKTFEPERIDSLLEALSLLQFPEDIFTPVDTWLKKMETLLERIEEEVFCEASFLDERGRLEPGFAINEMKTIISSKIPQMISHVTMCFNELEEQKHSEFTKLASAFFKEELSNRSQDFFKDCKEIGQYILYKRLLKDSTSLSKALLLPPIITKFLAKKSGEEHIDELISYSRGLFDIFYPEFNEEKLIYFLQEFSKKAKPLYGEDSVVKMCIMLQKELKEKAFDEPILSFIPGNLSFFKGNL